MAEQDPVELSPTKRALIELKELRAKVARLERARNEPIAIVGMGCRYPGAIVDPDSFWELLRAGGEGIREVPAERWDMDAFYDPDVDAPGKINTRRGGFLDGLELFDADFFGISPREAASMDPQQRLVLEVGWEALEHAGQNPDRLTGTRTGVFVGVSTTDYTTLVTRARELSGIDVYLATGAVSHAVASGRLSYLLGLQGPAISLDTACSTSLVSVHLACQALRLEECDLALAGGVNAVLTPDNMVSLAKGRMLAPDGRCKAFSAAADGFSRAEGAGLIVLKRLADAVRDGDRVWAVIRGSSVNQDGRSQGLTAPNGPAQEAVIRAALERAGVAPDAIDYVEAHGTGTSLGDPIEIGALAAVFGAGRTRALRVGSVKSNIGHAETAAGVAGLIKVALMLGHRAIPPSLHFTDPNPYIPWREIPIAIPTRLEPWEATDARPRMAGVSSFGFSGTNAHVVLEEAPERERTEVGERAAQVLTISAKTEAALRELAGRYEAVVGAMDAEELANACWTANTGRAQLRQRLAVVGSTGAELAAGLGAYRRGEPWPGLQVGRPAEGSGGRVAFLCTGQGPQYVGMGRELYRTLPVFREAIDRCAASVAGELPEALLEVMHPRAGMEAWAAERLNQTLYTQPALFAVEYGLAQVWRWLGVEPDVVLGHSSGEFVAATLAGVLTPEEGMRISLERGRLMQSTPVGEMMAVRAGEERVAAQVAAEARAGGQVSVAAINGPDNVVISGEGGAVRRVAARLEAEGVEVTALAVRVGGHSPLLDGVLSAFEAAAERIEQRAPQLELVSNVTGEVMRAGAFDGAYWRRHMREPVRFAQGIERAAALGCKVYVEVGPKPVLLGMAQLTAPDEQALWLPSLRADRGEWAQILDSVATYWASGRDIDWAALDRGKRRHKVALPTYPFQRQRFWVVPEGVPWNGQAAARPQMAAAADDAVGRLLYRIDWVADTTPSAASVPAPAEIVRALASGVATRAVDSSGTDGSDGVLDELDRLARSYAAAALRDLGVPLEAGVELTPEVVAGLDVAERHRPYLRRLLALLEEGGVLARHGHGWRVQRPGADGRADAARWVAQRHPEHRHDLAMLERCGLELAAVLRGDRDPLQVLFPDGSMEAAERVYRDSPFSRAYNRRVRAVLEQVAAALPTGQPLRVLEVGAGTGGTTAELLPALAGRSASYTFTDVTPGFAAHAKSRFDRYGFVDYRVLDVERAPEAQGFEPEGYDVVVAANVVHATRELRQTLAHLRRLLAPGGLLVLLEVTRPHPWIDLIFGMTPGWWRFADNELRAEHPLLAEDAWIELLNDAGFTDAAAVPGSAPAWGEEIQSVLIARAGPAEAANGPRTDGSWVLVAGRSDLAAHVARLLEDRGADVVTTVDGARWAETAGLERARELRGVIDLSSLDPVPPYGDASVAEGASAACRRVLALVRDLAAREQRGDARLWVATRCAQPAGGLTPDLGGAAQAPLWGLGRVIALEHPDIWGGLVDLEGGPAEADARALVDVVLSGRAEDQVAVRGGARLVARLAPHAAAPSGRDVPIRSDASYLVTGGLGALGLHVARWLVERGARHLLLVGRSGISERLAPDVRARREATLRELDERGARVHVVQADVGDLGAVGELFAQINASHPPLRGIVHAAGVAWTRPAAELTEDDLEAVFRPKVAGAWNLHLASERLGLDFFVLFSSAAATWGSAELAHYAAANHFLDALAHHRAGRGLPALGVDWGRWAGEGMTSEQRHDWLGRIGMDEFTVSEGLAALQRLLAEGTTQATVARMDWSVFKPIYEAKARGPLLERMGGNGAVSAAAAPEARNALDELLSAAPEARPPLMSRYLAGRVAAVMGLPATEGLERNRSLLDMGMDSLMAVQLRNRLQADLGVTVPIQRLMDSAGVAELEPELLTSIAGRAPAGAAMGAGAGAAEGLLAGLDDMSGGEIDELLQELLDESRGKG